MPRRLTSLSLFCLLVAGASAAEPRPALRIFPPAPGAREISSVRIFEDVLVPVGGEPAAEENAELARALEAFHARGNSEALEPFTDFLKAHPDSPWKASLLCNLGGLYYHGGYFTKALDAWDGAFALVKDSKDPKADPVRYRAIKELLDLDARLGRVPRVKELLDEAHKRPVPGWMAETVTGAQEGYVLMRDRPERAFRCGPLGLAMITQSMGQPMNALLDENCTPKGTSLAMNAALSAKVGLGLQMAKREPGAPLVFPALVHWKAGHFAALIKEYDGRYLVKDPTFGEEYWVSRKALDDELTGYALVRKGELPKGWRAVDEKEGAGIWGCGSTGNASPGNTTCRDLTKGGSSGSCSANGGACKQPGMPGYSFHAGVVSLHVVDTPIGYRPPLGPAVDFTVVYNQREVRRGEWVDFGNLGTQWTHNWDSYMVDDPGYSAGSQTLRMYEAGGGSMSYSGSGYNAAIACWSPHPKTHETLGTNQDMAHPVYTRTLTDGSKLIYASPDGSTTYPRRVYLSQVVDPQGNAVTLSYEPCSAVAAWGYAGYTGGMTVGQPSGYGGGMAIESYSGSGHGGLSLTAITDALGQVTHIKHDALLHITEVDDPFGRSAHFSYDDYSQLTSITDEAGLTSSFTYGYVYDQSQDLSAQHQRLGYMIDVSAQSGGDTFGGVACINLGQGQAALPNFMSSMTTPYGTTTFDMWENGTTRAIQATDPMGQTERLEFRHQAPGISGSDPQAPGLVANVNLDWRNSFYWNKRVLGLYGPDYTKAEIYHWLHGLDGEFATPTLEGEKKPLEKRVWYGHDNTFTFYPAVQPNPSNIMRALPNGGYQMWSYAYNAQGKPTASNDPLNRTFGYVYSADGLDLLEVHNITNPTTEATGPDELLATYTYNSHHQPLTATDASGQTSTMTYNAAGQITSSTDALGRTTSYTYSGGYLQSIQGPDSSATVSFGYDSCGRASDVTDSEGRTIHTTFDALDRPTRVDYPDGTYEAFVYDRLDLVKTRDRKGQTSVMTYNPLRQMTQIMDAQGRTTSFDWCGCGSLDSMVDPAGHMTTWLRDIENRVVAKIYDDQTQLSYVYDEVGRLAQRTDAMGQQTLYTYNWDNSLARVDYMNAQNPTPSVAYSYDGRYPRMTAMADGVGTTSFAYNPISTPPALGAGRLASVTGPWANDTISYSYDALGRVTSRSLNGATETRGFDTLGRLSTVVNPLGTFAYAYQGATGRLDHVTAPNGMVSAFTYEAAPNDRRVQQISHTRADGSLISSFAYTYDADGQIQTWTQANDVQAPKTYSFQYDAVGQILGATLQGPSGELIHQYSYAYDAAGNRTNETIDGGSTTSTYNNVNQLLSQGYTASGSSPELARKKRLSKAKRLQPASKQKVAR